MPFFCYATAQQRHRAAVCVVFFSFQLTEGEAGSACCLPCIIIQIYGLQALHRNVTICARVQGALGLNSAAEVPSVICCFTAHATASK